MKYKVIGATALLAVAVGLSAAPVATADPTPTPDWDLWDPDVMSQWLGEGYWEDGSHTRWCLAHKPEANCILVDIRPGPAWTGPWPE